MYDYWHTIGRAIMDPDLLTAINNANPAFDRVTRLITEADATGKITVVSNNSYTAGLLRGPETLAVRIAIWNWLVAHPLAAANPPLPPPISIYTAGRFSQFLTVASINFATRIGQANQAYQASLQGAVPATFSQRFPAFIGVCLIDSDLAGKLATPADPNVQNAIAQFGIDATPASTEWPVINRLVNHNSFVTSQAHLLTDDNNDWADLCGDQFDFWVTKNERAII